MKLNLCQSKHPPSCPSPARGEGTCFTYLATQYFLFVLFSFLLINTSAADTTTDQSVTALIQSTKNLPIDQKITIISEQLLYKPYVTEPCGEGFLGEYNQEPLYRFDEFDCETYVNTVLALALANNLTEFKNNLRNIVYTNGNISFINRSAFPSIDWVPRNIKNNVINEITQDIAGKNNIAISNVFIDRKNWYRKLPLSRIKIPTLTSQQQAIKLQQLHAEASHVTNAQAPIAYIPLDKLFNANQQPNLTIFNKIPNATIVLFVHEDPNEVNTIGTETNISHMGILIWKNNQLYLRAASSLHHRTIDLPFIHYLQMYLDDPLMKGIALFKVSPH